jgi:pyruvate/2-oxoglutarate dehydrogenase complex dihydrolipoamide acyltransferase (E2) component
VKYLDAVKAAGGTTKPSVVAPEDKMRSGSRPDQRRPEDLVSSPSRSTRGTPSRPRSNPSAEVESLASEFGIDLNDVKGTGANGEITMKDVRAHKAAREKRVETDPKV